MPLRHKQNGSNLCDSIEVVEAKVLRLGVEEAVFISAAWHNVGDVETVANADDADE